MKGRSYIDREGAPHPMPQGALGAQIGNVCNGRTVGQNV